MGADHICQRRPFEYGWKRVLYFGNYHDPGCDTDTKNIARHYHWLNELWGYKVLYRSDTGIKVELHCIALSEMPYADLNGGLVEAEGRRPSAT